ncbi:DoxX family protein [Mycetocola reblochoni]|uniref:DoxX family membrane protein n=2 Tax=Mycetocola reblochoni TaxID=331618 RepID=A0A3L6ZME6_9MICO|nr:hypothetical protein [Mycetocola reblochoni]RLP69008.1 hypothetical protein D9V30_09055 [Mycetocola reblochoni]SJN42378.1 putative membrane protein [Mycetocola reblochoni REB411]
MTQTTASAHTTTPARRSRRSPLRTLTRLALGAAMVGAGMSHLTVARTEFQAQVPEWVPADPDAVVVGSGFAEIALGGGLLLSWGAPRRRIARLLAVFFIAVFPGNLSQFVNRRDGFGLDTDAKRGVRLLFQPVLVALALYAGGARRR